MPLSGKLPGALSAAGAVGATSGETQRELRRIVDPNLNWVATEEGGSGNFGVFRVHFESTRAPTIAESGRSTTSSFRSARTALDLQRLEEERRLEKEFLAKKYDILQAQLEQEGDGSVRSHRSRSSAQRTQEWVQSLDIPTTSIATEPPQVPVGSQSRTGTIPKSAPVVSLSATATTKSGEQDRQPLSCSTYRVDRVVSNVKQPTVSSIAQTSNVAQTKVVSSGTVCEGAVGGFSPISPVRTINRAPVNFTFSPAERLTKEIFDLQKRMENLQQQLSTERLHHSQQQVQPDRTSGQVIPHAPVTRPSGSLGQTKRLSMPSRNPVLEFPPEGSIRAVVSSVSQSCSNITMTTANQVRTSMSQINSLPPPAQPPDMINKTPPYATGPCLLPPFMPFAPAHPPLAHSTPPSVHTVSSHVSPVMSSMIPTSAPISAAADIVPRQLFGGPNSQQLAARQVVPRELPAFSGDPVEWPLFLSCYQNSTEMCGYSDGENLMRLQRCLKGNALEAVRSFLMHPSSVQLIIDTLRTLYGRPELIINALLVKVRATPSPKSDHLETLITFGLACKNLCCHLQAGGLQDHLSNPLLLQELVNKLPATLKLNWSLFKRQHAIVDLTTFGCYMDQIVTAASDVTFSYSDGHRPSNHEKQKPKEKMYVNAHATEGRKVESSNNVKPQENKPKPCTACQKEGHKARDCQVFRKMTLSDRWKLVQDRYLCRRCLGSHGRFPCKASPCGENGCEERHHKLLHPGKPESPQPTDTPRTTSTLTVHRQLHQRVLFRIIPVMLHNGYKNIRTYAFLDDGSSKTLMESKVAEELGVSGDVHPLCLQWTSGVERMEDESQRIKLEVSGVENSKRHLLKEVYTVKNLGLPTQSLNFSELAKECPHLQGLPVHSYVDAVPTILIGLDNSYVMTSLKCREGTRGSPVASKTRLGWTISGAVSAGIKPSAHHLLHICVHSPDQELHEIVKQFFALESVGSASSTMESDDDQRARRILESTAVRTESGKFQIGLTWKFDHVEFPNSRPMAEKRFRCLERRLASNPDLYAKVKDQLQEYLSKGYAHKVDPEELDSFDPKRTWYLPLNVVTNPRKPKKFRFVWDAAAKVQGQSLNSALLAGPDLLTPLPAVLCPFRQFEIAITGDVCEMFHQLFVQPNDRPAQLFLFRDDPSKPFDVYVMDVATFGATCSPAAAQFVKNRNAEEYAEEYPLAAEAIIKHHYVDDFLYSTDTEEEAIELALQVKLVHSKAGFNIRNWLSNSDRVLTRVGEHRAESSKLLVDKASAYERVLGMIWKPKADVFVYQGVFRGQLQELLKGGVVPTKREVLRVTMSIFDPLGLVAIFVVHGKILVQHIWRTGLDWDARISGDLLHEWKRWINLLRQLDQVEIPRCYFPGYTSEAYRSLELHIFVDASEEAYAAAAYFRIVDGSRVRCSLVSAKTKVSPLKLLSIPRLELLAAVLGAKLSKSVVENHKLPITRKVLWSDAATFHSWLRSDPRKYRQFVAFRLTEILELTQVDEWRWVPSCLNVADDATKWGKGPNINNESRWFNAPEFLYQHPDLWPKQTATIEETVEELRPIHVHHHLAVEQLVQFTRFSKWERLVRAVAYVHRYIDILRCRIKKEAIVKAEWLERDELQKAESTIFKLIQHEAYGDEIIMLHRNQELPVEQQPRIEKSSKIGKLSPFLDNQGIIRMDSRIATAQQVSFDFKFPVILPKANGGTKLLVDWYHRQFNHGNVETAVNEMRQKFHVSEMRVAFKQARKRCQWCAVYKAVPAVPRMAPLPLARTTSHLRPFTYVGVDYFGPLLIRQGRSEVKRWVALFTCLTIRAVHLEVVHSLTTESCKMAIRRFIARRGAPSEIFSDRGTNFVGASRDLKAELQRINKNLASTFTNTDTQWRFNPPSTPHMGGSWERMVRSVKSALASMHVGRNPDDETLRTLLTEAESMVNSRPLTYLPIDSEEQEALSPNSFLLLSTSGVNQPARELIDDRAVARCNWNLCQQLLDRFWSRWIKEYLPTITKRTKWFADSRPVQVGDLVVVVDERVRNGWTRGRVLRVFPGRDGRVRHAEVKKADGGVLDKSVANLAVLEVGGTAEVGFMQYGSGIVPNNANPAPGSERVTRSTRRR